MAPLGLPSRYRVDGLIATGGMAAVYAAHDTVLDRPVAVKVLAEHLLERDEARRRFEREARAAAALSSHPSVVTVYNVGEHDGRAFIVMERRLGGTVAAAGEVSRERALRWLADVAGALDAAHAAGIVHRDVKPANLLLDEADRVAIADFGIASLANEHERVTQTGEVLGSGAYLSPEQARGEDAGPAADRYALAVVAYELLTGAPPFAGTFPAQVRAHAHDAPPPATGLPVTAQRVLAQGLAKAPRERWGTATGLVTALGAALDTAAPEPRLDATPPPPAPQPPRNAARGTPTAVHETERLGTPGGAGGVGRGFGAHAGGAPARDGSGRRAGGDATPSAPGRDRRSLIAAAATLAVAAVVAGAVLGADGDEPAGNRAAASATARPDRADRPRRSRPNRTRTPAPTSTATPAAVTSAPPTTTPTPEPADPPDGDPAALNADGYAALQRGDDLQALGTLTRAVDACSGNDALDPCGFATYNLGLALVANGRAADAVGLFKERLYRWPDDQPEVVRKALRDAERGAGGGPAGGPGPGDGPSSTPGARGRPGPRTPPG